MQTSGEMRREIAKSYLRRMGRAKRNPSSSAPARGIDGYRCAPPILRDYGLLRSQWRSGDSSLDHGCRSAILVEGLQSTSCRGMVDAIFEGFTTFLDRAACLTR
jgi:hypothetical protein